MTLYQLSELDKTIFLLELSDKPKIIYTTQNISDPHDFENLEKCIISKAEFVTKENSQMYVSSKEVKEPHNHTIEAIFSRIITNNQQGNCIIGEGVMNFYTYTFTLKDKMVKEKKRIFLFLMLYSSLRELSYTWMFLQNTLDSFATNLKVRAKIIYENEVTTKIETVRNLNELLALNEFEEQFHIFSSCILKTLNEKVIIKSYDILEKPPIELSFNRLYALIKSINEKEAKNFFKIIYNVLIGNQLVVKSKNLPFANEILILMQNLIPKECVKASYNSKQYCYFSSNFLSIDDTVNIPFEEIDESMTIVLEIEGDIYKISNVKIIYKDEIQNPTFLSRFEKMIDNESLESYFIEQIKQEFLR